MIENILSKIQTPSRYLGNEINSIHKKWNEVKIHVALAFPDLYDIGTSHLGIQILYNILNNNNNTLAERVFAPAKDMEQKIQSSGFQLKSLESQTPLKHFDIIGFSLLYELNYTNMLNMLHLSKIPFLASERDNKYPLLIAGGPCTSNPEPIADFFDAILIGDGEDSIISITNTWNDWKQNGGYNKNDLFKEWLKINGVYIPSFYEQSYDLNGHQKLSAYYPQYERVRKAIVTDLSKTPLMINPIVPFGKPVHDRLKIELARGCSRGCRFCQAGMIYRPVRERSTKEIIKIITKSIETTGYEDLSLLSLSTGDYCSILPLMEEIIEYGVKNNVSVSLPSLRADTLTTELMNLIKQVRKTGFTIAPEAGSQRLRNVINKNICETEIISTVSSAFSLGWKVIKLYFMIGLPTETQEDLREIVCLIKKLNLLRKSFGGKTKINVSITTFVPKAHTPFQWVKQINLENSKIKINWLKEQLKIPGVNLKWQDPHVSFVEGLFARGNRSLSKLLINAFKEGCKFDSWSDSFSFPKWEKALNCNIKEKKSNHSIALKTPLPWDHIDIGVKKKFFLQEFKKALLRKTTSDCRNNKCHSCGVCDFKSIKPIIHNETQLKSKKNTTKKQKDKIYKKINIVFSKTGNAQYFGHLEMVKIFYRSLKRSKIPIQYSKGFHPSPKIAFKDALPIGIESINELMTLTVPYNFKFESIKLKLNNQLPNGLGILKCYHSKDNILFPVLDKQDYFIESRETMFAQPKLDSFLKKENVFLSTRNRKGKLTEYNLNRIISNIKIYNDKTLKLILNLKENPTLRPYPIVSFIFKLNEAQREYLRIIKL